MTRLYKLLVSQMRQKIALYNELIPLFQEEWDSIVDYSLDEVRAVLKKKEILALKMQMLEENRLKVVAEIANHLGVDPENLTLRDIIKVCGRPLSTQLTAQRETLLSQISAIFDYSEKNKHLVNRSSLSIKKSLVFLHRTQDSAEAAYGADGHRGEGKALCRMLSTEV
ncbi:MAG: flagellar protein FlgN [Nitrospinales bacterium]